MKKFREPRILAVEEIQRACLVDPLTGCWLWQGTLTADGYGRLGRGYAHRAAVVALTGEPIPAGLQVDHICHNEAGGCDPSACQHRRCCNPDHLRLVSAKINTLASPGTIAGRNARKTKCHAGHPLSGANLRVEVDRRGYEHRRCIECVRVRHRQGASLAPLADRQRYAA